MDLTGLPPHALAEHERVVALARGDLGLTVIDAQDLAEAQGIDLKGHRGARAGRGAFHVTRLNVEMGEDGRVRKAWVG